MKKSLTITLILFGLTLGSLCPATAHELRLSNGDVLNGQVVRKEENKLIFKTSYAGEINVNWTEVIQIVTDDPIRVILADGTIYEGISRKAPPNMMRIETEKLATPADFKLSEVAAINPTHKPVVKIKTRVNAGLTQERGNSDNDSLRVAGNFTARAEKNRFNLGGELNLEKVDGDSSVENWLAFSKYDYFFVPQWFLYTSALFEHDKFADLELRSTNWFNCFTPRPAS